MQRAPLFNFFQDSITGAGCARAGHFYTSHGKILTPAFMPVGTQGTIKGLTPEQILEINPQVILGNAYHLNLRPSSEVIKQLGGLHKFMRWNGPILTDSGGFQIFSLKSLRKINEDGAIFQSHIDGSTHYLSPERSMEIQRNLGSDIVMALDECPSGQIERSKLQISMARTIRWLKRCRLSKLDNHQGLFAINQGGIHLDLRHQHLNEILELDSKSPFQGIAIGGLSVGEPKYAMNEILASFVRELPQDRPRYLMGVGAPEDILFGIEYGVDLFDCVLPTREARHGTLLTSNGKIRIKNAKYKYDTYPIDNNCHCYTCRTFTRAYLNHLFRAGELLAYTLASIHNLNYIIELTRSARTAILENRFSKFADQIRENWFSQES